MKLGYNLYELQILFQQTSGGYGLSLGWEQPLHYLSSPTYAVPYGENTKHKVITS